MMSKDSLDSIRQQIDALDDQIVELLGDRFDLISEVSRVKQENGLDPYQSGREKAILDRVLAKGKIRGLNPILLQALFLQIFAVSKRNQSS